MLEIVRPLEAADLMVMFGISTVLAAHLVRTMSGCYKKRR